MSDKLELLEKLQAIETEIKNLKASEPTDTPRGVDLDSNNTGPLLTEEQKQSSSQTVNLPQENSVPTLADFEAKIGKIKEFVASLEVYRKKHLQLSKEMTRDITLKGQDKAHAELYEWIIASINSIIK